MTGNQDKAAAAAAWVEAGRERLIAACDQVLDAITATKVEPNDSLGAARQVRAIELMARTMPVVALMSLPDEVIKAAKGDRASTRGGSCADQTSTEDHMNDNERDDSPENLQRLRDELDARIARLHAGFEKKGADRPGDPGSTARDEPDEI
jgi:hypothetical protein